MGAGQSKSFAEEVHSCVEETARKYNVSNSEVLRALKDDPTILEVYTRPFIENIPRKAFVPSVITRQMFADAVEAGFVSVESENACMPPLIGSDPANELSQLMRAEKLLGRGSFGSVYKACIPKRSSSECEIDFAVKLESIPVTATRKPLKDVKTIEKMREYYITEMVQKHVLAEGRGQAVPFMFKAFKCVDKCSLDAEHPPKKKGHCLVSMIELASGTLWDWVKTEYAILPHAFENVLFQLMAGLAALQTDGLQLHHTDIKALNILYHEVPAGGYWTYVIDGQTFYVPNMGFVMIISDYGACEILEPAMKCHKNVCRFGERGMIRDVKSGVTHLVGHSETQLACPYTAVGFPPRDIKTDDRLPFFRQSASGHMYFHPFTPDRLTGKNKLPTAFKFETARGVEILEENGFANPFDALFDVGLYKRTDIFPPVNFAYDTQDMIKMFVDGKRMVQPGNHGSKVMNEAPEAFIAKLGEYAETSSMPRTIRLENRCCYARDFIHHFFSDDLYKTKPAQGELLSEFIVE